jgi:DNA-binding beta-propeller fold protein YncE
MNNPQSGHFYIRWIVTVILALVSVTPSTAEVRLNLKYLYAVDRYSDNLRFITPTAVFLDSKRQELYVCDSAASKLITLTAAGAPLDYFYHRQTGKEANQEPVGVAVNSQNGTVFVSDASDGRIYKYDYRGTPAGYISMPNGSGYLPGKMALDGTGNLYVAIRNAGKVIVFDPDGQIKTEIGSTEPGGMQACCDVAVDIDGNVYALSPAGTAVYVFDNQGKCIRKFGSHQPGKNGFARPSAIDVDSKGRIWITDTANQTLRAFRPDGTFLAVFGGFGTGPGDFFSPSDVFVDRVKSTLFVVEKSGQRLQAFAIEER